MQKNYQSKSPSGVFLSCFGHKLGSFTQWVIVCVLFTHGQKSMCKVGQKRDRSEWCVTGADIRWLDRGKRVFTWISVQRTRSILAVTMESSKLWTTAMACAVLLSCIQGAEMDFDNESDLETRALREFYPKDPNLTNEKQLVSIA